LFLRAEIERSVATAGRDRHQRREQWSCRTEIIGGFGKQCLELVEPLFVRVLALKSSGPLKVRHRRVKCGILVMG
jgi:hypothetical protein